jgi:predicted permease
MPPLMQNTANYFDVLATPLALLTIGATFKVDKLFIDIKPAAAAAMGGDENLAASIVMLTTLGSVFSLTLFVFVFKLIKIIGCIINVVKKKM